MPSFNWQDIDHSLVQLKITDLAEKMRKSMKRAEACIRYKNRGNLNDCAVPTLILRMKQGNADRWARRIYAIYSDVWQTQGYSKSAAFIRAVCSQAVAPAIRARANAIADEFARFAWQTNFSPAIRDAMLETLDREMKRLQSRWERRLEAEAKEREYAERRALMASIDVPTSVAAIRATALKNSLRAEISQLDWNKIEIKFLSDERISISAGEHKETRNYAEFGFEDRRIGKPNKAWGVLRDLALGNGTLGRASGTRTWASIEKSIQQIRRALRNHFGQSTDPIPFVPRIGYQAKFKISCGPSFHT